MCKDSSITLSKEYVHFESAINSEYMLKRLSEVLPGFFGKSIELKRLVVPRVFVRKDGGIAIQYLAEVYETADKRKRKLYLYGIIFNEDVRRPAWADPANEKIICLNDLQMVMPVFPYDPELSYLSDFYDPGEESPVISYINSLPLFNGGRCKILNCEILSYRFERRCVLKYDLECQDGIERKRLNLIAKLYRPQHVRKAAEKIKFLESNGFSAGGDNRLTVPSILTYDNNSGILFMEFIPATSLHSLINEESFVDGCRAAGQILKKLHELEPGDHDIYTFNDEIEKLKESADLIRKIYPDIYYPVNEALILLRQAKMESLGNCFPACTHRDFYDKQIMYSASRISLLDCDNLAPADPALDYGNFMAHMELRQMQYPKNTDLIINGSRNFKIGYNNSDRDFEIRAKWWQAAALIRLALIYILRPQWQHLSPALLEKTKNILFACRRP